jgi:hypothetical protein
MQMFEFRPKGPYPPRSFANGEGRNCLRPKTLAAGQKRQRQETATPKNSNAEKQQRRKTATTKNSNAEKQQRLKTATPENSNA